MHKAHRCMKKGGYTVPREMHDKITEVMKAYGGIASIAHIMTTESGHPLHWPVSDGTHDMGIIVGEHKKADESEVLYGAFTTGAVLIKGLKSQLRLAPNWSTLKSEQKEALEIIVHKMGHILNAAPDYADSWADIAGYAQMISNKLEKN